MASIIDISIIIIDQRGLRHVSQTSHYYVINHDVIKVRNFYILFVLTSSLRMDLLDYIVLAKIGH